MHRNAARLLALVLTSAALTGCDDAPIAPPDAQTIDVQVVDTAGPIFRSLRVDLDQADDVEVFYEPIDGGRTFRMRSESALSHDVLLPRLLPDTTYRYAVRSGNATAAAATIVRGTLSTAPLPEDLSGIDYSVEGSATFPLLIFNHRVDGGFDGMIAMEASGAIVWYTPVAGAAATPIPGSHDMLFISGGTESIVRVSPRGQIVDQMSFARVEGAGVHHDLAALDAARVAFIAQEDRTVRDTLVSGEAVWIWNMETGTVEQVWSAWDHFDWDTDRGARSVPDDWLHANALSVGPRGNLILSLHFLNQIVSIAADYQSLEWRLGGVNATIAVSSADAFNGQHSVFELPGGHVLLFDNNYEGAPAGGHSRGLELEIDGDSARAVWEYVADPPIMSRIWSGIYPLENGHRVVSFPIPDVVQPAGGAPPFTVDEVDATGQRVWRLTGEGLTASFRGVPWPSIAGEERVEGMP